MATRRALTTGEIDAARRAFGDRIDYRRVRLVDGAALNPIALAALTKGNPAITVGSTIHFKTHFCADFCAPEANLNSFMHEMTHVWQYQRLGITRFLLRYGKEFAKARGNARAMYIYRRGVKFDDAMLEAQAQMVGDYSAPAPGRPAPDRALIAENLARTGIYGL